MCQLLAFLSLLSVRTDIHCDDISFFALLIKATALLCRLVTSFDSLGHPLTACIVLSGCPQSRQLGVDAFFSLNALACVYRVPVSTLRALVTCLPVTRVDVRYVELTLSNGCCCMFSCCKIDAVKVGGAKLVGGMCQWF